MIMPRLLVALAALAAAAVCAGPVRAEGAADCVIRPVSPRAQALARWSRDRQLAELAKSSLDRARRDYRRAQLERVQAGLVEGTVSPFGQARALEEAFSGVEYDAAVVAARKSAAAAQAKADQAEREMEAQHPELLHGVLRARRPAGAFAFVYAEADGAPYGDVGLEKDVDFAVGRCDPRHVDGSR